MRTWVMQNREGAGWSLMLLVIAVMALDWFFGSRLDVGRHLPLRVVYFGLSCLIIGYLYILATSSWNAVAVQRRD